MDHKMKFFQMALLSVIIIALAVLYYLHFDGEKVAYVDSSKLMNKYEGMVEARKSYQQKSTVWRANLDTLKRELENSIRSFKQKNASMTEKERSLSRELIKTKQKQFKDYQKALNEKASNQDAELTRKVLSEVNAYIKRYGDEHGYDIIMVATQYGNIAYAREGMDITDNVLKGLNKEYNGN